MRMSQLIERVEATLKRTLQVGEVLRHGFLGNVLFTERAQQLEQQFGKPGSLFVEQNGHVVELTLGLIYREVDGEWLRLNEDSNDLDDRLSYAKRHCPHADIMKHQPLVTAIMSRCTQPLVY